LGRASPPSWLLHRRRIWPPEEGFVRGQWPRALPRAPALSSTITIMLLGHLRAEEEATGGALLQLLGARSPSSRHHPLLPPADQRGTAAHRRIVTGAALRSECRRSILAIQCSRLRVRFRSHSLLAFLSLSPFSMEMGYRRELMRKIPAYRL
jgi:hypothetical protein